MAQAAGSKRKSFLLRDSVGIRLNRPEGMNNDRAVEPLRTSTTRRRVGQVREGVVRVREDALAVEEPLELRLCPRDQSYLQVAVTMRTPGHDFELAAGFLFTEGIVQTAEQIDRINYCADHSLDSAQRYNIVNVFLRPGVRIDPERLQRNFYTTSSCGVCGKASIEAIQVRGISPVLDDGFVVDSEVLGGLAEALRGAQAIFDKTGGLHAAALFDERGRLVSIREDVGRHNAVDKLIGHAFLNRTPPLRRHLLMVSGRASFEITQKAAAAGVPVLAAISAPSSLACDVAQAFGMTLVGFMRGDRFTVYTGTKRIRHGGQTVTGVD